jgi:LmbE family N-acetylglucosaminyl deacetylase
VRPAGYVAELGSVVVVAPHPDDESLGCGGLLALLSRAGQPVAGVLVSDGTMSHPNSVRFPAHARQAVRETEFREALSLLGVTAEPLLLGLPDSQVPAAPLEPGFKQAVTQLASFLENHQATTVLVPWRRDPHPDHRATSLLVQAALAALPQPPRRLEYVVWAWERAREEDLPAATDGVQGFRLNVEEVLAQKQQAIAAHRSQVAPGVFTDDPDGFLLSAEMLAHFAASHEVFFEALDS